MSATPYPQAYSKPWWQVGDLLPSGQAAPTVAWQNMGVGNTPSPDIAFNALRNANYGAPKQDTGATPAQPATTGAAWASGGGTLPEGFNVWQNNVEPGTYQGWDYTTDPYFKASADRPKWDLAQSGAGSETDRAKVWRLAFDYMRDKFGITSPGSATQAQTREAFLYGVQRLKTDYNAPENAAKGGWQGSPYAGYDQFLPGGQGGTGTGQGTGQFNPNTSPGDPGWRGSIDYANPGQGQTGGNTVNPPYPSAGPTPSPTPAGSAPAGTTPGAPAGTTTAGGAVPAGAYYRTNPSVAVSQFLQQHNIGTADHGPFADFLRKLATGIVTPVMSIMPPGANGQTAGDQLNNLPSIINNLIYGNGGQVFGNLANFATQAQGQFGPSKLGGMSFPDVQGLLSTINALKTMGQNPYMQSFNQQALADLFQKYQDTNFAAGRDNQPSVNPDWLVNPTNDPYGLFR